MRVGDAVRLTFLGAIWGSSFLFMKVALDGYSPLQIAAGRLAIGALTMLVLARVTGARLPRDKRIWGMLAVMALLANVAPFTLIAFGQQHITSAMAAILNSTTPLFTAMFATLALPTERLTPLRGLGIAIGFAGIVVIVGGDTGGSLFGQSLIVLAAALYGIGFVYSRKNLSSAGLSALAIPAGQLLVGATFLMPIALVDAGVAGAPTYGLQETISMLALGAFGTGIAFWLYYRLIKDVGATTASFVTYLIPIFGVLLGWIVLGERTGWNALVGAGIVIAGIALAERGRAAPPPLSDDEGVRALRNRDDEHTVDERRSDRVAVD